MHVNDELHEIAKGLPMIVERLRPKGRLATLRSLEHTLARIVKQRSSSSNMTVELTPNLLNLSVLGALCVHLT